MKIFIENEMGVFEISVIYLTKTFFILRRIQKYITIKSLEIKYQNILKIRTLRA